MIDFRYHALSLVAVFLALGIGIILGVTIGDDLVSETDKRLREDLREDVVEARDDSAEQARLAGLREKALIEAAPLVAGGRLAGERLGLIGLGALPGDLADSVDAAAGLGGAQLASRTALDVPGDLDELADALGAATPVASAGQAARLGARLARRVESGGRGLGGLRDALPRSFGGDYRRPLDAVVLYRQPPPDELEADQRELRDAFDEGLGDALRRPVVGVETLGSDPSQVDWYDDHAEASVDNIELAAGRLALVLALDLGATARFGFQPTADRVLPELSAR